MERFPWDDLRKKTDGQQHITNATFAKKQAQKVVNVAAVLLAAGRGRRDALET